MTRYCLGFLFDETGEQVLLLEKSRPAWQAGRTNGIGGHVELGEDPLVAMQREAVEEVGDVMLGVAWEEFAVMRGPGFLVYCFRARLATTDWHATSFVRLTEEGLLFVSLVDHLPQTVLSNLRWLIPLALDTARLETGVHGPPLSCYVTYGL